MLNSEDYIFKIYGAVFGHHDLDLLQSAKYYLHESIRSNCVPTWLSPCILSRLIPVAIEPELPLGTGSHTFPTQL